MSMIFIRAGASALRAASVLPSLSTSLFETIQPHSSCCSCSSCVHGRSCVSNAFAPHASHCQCAGRATRPVAGSWLQNTFSSPLSTQAARFSTKIQYPPSELVVGSPAPDFSAPAVVDGEFKTITLSQYRGKYVCLFFYPKDFTFVCPTEIIAFSDRAKEFQAINTQLIAASTDTEETHLAWIKTPRNKGGLGYMQIPIVADTTKEIAARYGVLIPSSGIALRGLFIIDPEGTVRQITINDLPIGRSVEEALRLVQAIQFHAEHGEVCPANWKPGERTMVADPEKSMDYFAHTPDTQASDDIGTKLHPIKSKREFDTLINSGKPVVLDFYAPWCGKCRMIGPFVDELVPKFPGITFAKVDTTMEGLEALSSELGVKALPAFKFFKGGKEVVDTVVGYKKKPLEEAVEKLSKK